MKGRKMARPWRKLVKKLQRKRRRQQAARARDKKLEEDELAQRSDPSYPKWLEYKEQFEERKRLADEKAQQENEELWLRRELLAQKQFQRDKQKRMEEEMAKEAIRLQQEQELKEREDAAKLKREEIKKKTEEAAKDFEDTMQLMQMYLDDCDMRTPTKLQGRIETRPGEKPCEFYEKTHCCRFGICCHNNHARPMLSRVIVIRNFFQHRLLDQQLHKEYASSEEQIEVSECDLKTDYAEFCADVWPELEQFGTIINFRTVRNRLPHARGHVFVEYTNKRSALKAFVNLQNRFYASKRLNVEFSHISHWRSAVCGFSLARKCPKGAYCNYLHIIPNPGKKYNAPLEPLLERSLRTKYNSETPTLSWNSTAPDDAGLRNWRWSESPETEIVPRTTKTVTEDKTANNKSVTDNSPQKSKSSVHSSSSSEDSEEEEKGKRKSSAELTKNLKRKKRASNWSHMPSGSTEKTPNNGDRSESNVSIDLCSSTSDSEIEGNQQRESNENIHRKHSTSEDRRSRKHFKKSKRKHGEESPSKERRHKGSSRKSSHHHRSKTHKYSDKSR